MTIGHFHSIESDAQPYNATAVPYSFYFSLMINERTNFCEDAQSSMIFNVTHYVEQPIQASDK